MACPMAVPSASVVRAPRLMRTYFSLDRHGSIGFGSGEYGGRKRKGTSIEHVKDSGGSAIREPLQQLEKAGLVAKEGPKGRKLSGEGVSLLNRVSGEILKGSSSGEGSKQ